MKKELIGIFVLSLVVFSAISVSALSSTMKNSYAPKETVIAELSGNILTSISKEQMKLKRNNVNVPFEYDLKKLGDQYYFWFITPSNSGNYTLIISGVNTIVDGKVQAVDYTKLFSVGGSTKKYSVSPGVILTSEDFVITAVVNGDTSETISVSFPQTHDVTLRPGSNMISFPTSTVLGTQETMISVGEYSIPAYIRGKENSSEELVCGDEGELCCLGNICNNGFNCTEGVCQGACTGVSCSAICSNNSLVTRKCLGGTCVPDQAYNCPYGCNSTSLQCNAVSNVCGISGQSCCSGNVCNNGSICSNGVCLDSCAGVPCGPVCSGNGLVVRSCVQGKCTNSSTISCTQGCNNTLTPNQCNEPIINPNGCGGPGQACCIWGTCLYGLNCTGGVCTPVAGFPWNNQTNQTGGVPARFRFSPRIISSTVLLRSASPTYQVEITNLEDYPVDDILFIYRKDILSVPYRNITLGPNETLIFNVTVKNTNLTRELKEVIYARRGDDMDYLLVRVGFTRNANETGTSYIKKGDNESTLYYCSELSGVKCEDAEVCSGQTIASVEGGCCIGRCEEPKKSGGSTWKLVGYGIIGLVVVGGLILFFRYKNVKPPVNPIAAKAGAKKPGMP